MKDDGRVSRERLVQLFGALRRAEGEQEWGSLRRLRSWFVLLIRFLKGG